MTLNGYNTVVKISEISLIEYADIKRIWGREEYIKCSNSGLAHPLPWS
jgi:hypothetical protein